MTVSASSTDVCVRRPATPADSTFLRDLCASTRSDLDGLGLPEETLVAIVELQWRAQRSGYAAAYPDALDEVIELGGAPGGRVLTAASDRDVVLIDLALLPEHRGHGVGRRVIEDVQRVASASGRGVRLHVEAGNPARRLYERLGFVAAGIRGIHIEMRWRP